MDVSLCPNLGFAGMFGADTLVLLGGALAVTVMGVPTRDRPLEAIAAPEFGGAPSIAASEPAGMSRPADARS